MSTYEVVSLVSIEVTTQTAHVASQLARDCQLEKTDPVPQQPHFCNNVSVEYLNSKLICLFVLDTVDRVGGAGAGGL